MTVHAKAPRAGFTLVELLVVILIIGILAALSLTAFNEVRKTARKTQASTEMAQLADAIAAFKAKMNVSYIPAFGGGTNGKFRLKRTYNVTADPTLAVELNYLRQVFPQMPYLSGTDDGGATYSGGTNIVSEQELDPNQTLMFFLTGGYSSDFQGFSTDRRQPFKAPTGSDSRIGPFFDVSKSRRVKPAGAAAFQDHYVDPWGTPYAYFSFDPTINGYPFSATIPARYAWPKKGDTFGLDPDLNVPNAPTDRGLFPFRQGGKFLNAKGFQIVSAGPNKQFGYVPLNEGTTPSLSDWTPGQGDFISTGVGADDLSNFNAGSMNQQGQ